MENMRLDNLWEIIFLPYKLTSQKTKLFLSQNFLKSSLILDLSRVQNWFLRFSIPFSYNSMKKLFAFISEGFCRMEVLAGIFSGGRSGSVIIRFPPSFSTAQLFFTKNFTI